MPATVLNVALIEGSEKCRAIPTNVERTRTKIVAQPVQILYDMGTYNYMNHHDVSASWFYQSLAEVGRLFRAKLDPKE